jgi:anti-sigma factor RsiW
MNCTTCQNELEDFLYGELDDVRAQTLRAHLRNCAECTQMHAALEREQEIFAQYYEQTAPVLNEALWQGIQTRIQIEAAARVTPRQDESSVSWWQRMFGDAVWLRQMAFATALVLASVAATTVYFKWQAQPQPVNNDIASKRGMPAPPTVTPAPAPTPAEPVMPKATAPHKVRPSQPKLTEEQALENQLARAEREYQQAIKLLDRVIARRRDQLDPAVRQQYESSLALIDNSIAESRRALRADPANVVSGQFLLAAYAKKLDLMRDIAMNAGQ